MIYTDVHLFFFQNPEPSADNFEPEPLPSSSNDEDYFFDFLTEEEEEESGEDGDLLVIAPSFSLELPLASDDRPAALLQTRPFFADDAVRRRQSLHVERTGSDVTAATRFGDAPPSAASGVGESQTYMMISDSFSEKEVREALAPSHSGLVSASIASVPSSPASSATLTHSSSLSLSSSYSTSSNEGSPIIAHQEPNQPRSDTATTTNNNNIADQEARNYLRINT